MQSNVIYTEKNECQECCKCVRNCPVKAIRIINHSAQIDYDRCIACGTCVQVCPAGAQRVRNDVNRVKMLFDLKEKVILSVAPSFVSEFDNPKKLLAKAKKAGFYAVSETALGADIVSYFQKRKMKEDNSLMFSTACPVTVDYIQKYNPEYIKFLSPYLSPLLTHCLFLKSFYGEEIGIVFAGPCIAKKKESDLYPEYLDVALTFDELRGFFEEIEITEDELENSKVDFEPYRSISGVIYPIEGGMLQTLSEYDLKDASYINEGYFSLSGFKEIMCLLEKEDLSTLSQTFCEFLACKGGCINGSGLKNKGDIISRKKKVVAYYKNVRSGTNKKLDLSTSNLKKPPLYDKRFSDPVKKSHFSQEEKDTVLKKIGMFSKEDMLDCGGCGYDTCEEFAEACLSGLAEPDMCVINMKRLAQDKLNTLIKTLPLGVVIVDEKMNIIECNAKFVEMFVGIEADEKVISRFKGRNISKFVETGNVALKTFEVGKLKTVIRSGQKIFEVYSFAINKEMIGMIFQDITKLAVKREMIVKKAEEVIQKNLQVVQKIAFLLGENAAEAEVILNSLIEAINTSEGENGKDRGS